ncbi:Uncharacterised protein [Legionella steigerwaltii]|uniref:Lipoprotein n=1 Tax=Legionella steigerwaltii TaxID=460 RepID=A0A378L739_9GAMM|nr:hypothetical protein [Legionella steigerwaltii]KTD71982.1 hypothetical protein Lstg_2683 [Legionella steigerwaltii]STY21648.1 Uncharacterised protein [Legionella steigerwaltii]
MITNKLLRKIFTIFYLSGTILFLSSCASTKNSTPQNTGGEEYGTNDYGGWR